MGRPAIDMKGQRFGRLTVLEKVDGPNNKTAYWKCACDCGTQKIVSRSQLIHGETHSCGCLQRECVGDRARTHGGHKTRLYSIWRHMKERCYKTYSPKYSLYGGRGITVCDEWKSNFTNFRDWALSHGYQDDLTLDRIDNDKGYCPENCRWANSSTQNKNRRPFPRTRRCK